MYKPPENANRVKAIKSKFESCSQDVESNTKPVLRKSKTLQDFNIESVKIDLSHCKIEGYVKKSTDNERNENTQTHLSRQLSDPAKRNIKRTHAFRLERNLTSDKTVQKDGRLSQNKSRYLDSKVEKPDSSSTLECDNEDVNYKEHLSKTKINGYGHTTVTINFSKIRNKFNGSNSDSLDTNLNITNNDNEKINKTDKDVLKYLYSEPLPKSQRVKPDNLNNDSLNNFSTLKQFETSKHVEHVSDDETHRNSKNLTKSNLHYGSLRAKKSSEDFSFVSHQSVDSLTDTLKTALKKPLPVGPAPKKPPRTFAHGPNRNGTSEVSQLNLDNKFVKKLNTDLKRNAENKTIKSDPKYMLDKLESALKNKGILTRKSKLESTILSGEDNDDEKNRLKFLNLRDLPSIPISESHPKFNLNCLSSLGCAASAYEPTKASNSSFFVKTKKNEPVYAEPFEYQVEVEMRSKSEPDKDSAVDENSSMKTIRRSIHYASSPVPDPKIEEGNNHVTSQDQVAFDSTSLSSACTSDMDSLVSTPSEENKTLSPGFKVKDLIKAIENSNFNKLSDTCLNVSRLNNNVDNSLGEFQTDDDRIVKLKKQLRNTIDESFAMSPDPSPDEISTGDVHEDESDGKPESKFRTYVKRVRSRIFNLVQKRKEHLFQCCMLVALDRSTPYVKSKFPQHVQEPYRIADLCFPEVENGSMDTSAKAQCYSLIITNEMGERTFGYCRRVLPEASTTCLPLAYCILTKHRAPGFYKRVLEELEHRHGYPDKFKDAFLEELYSCRFPQPGETIVIDCARIIANLECERRIHFKKIPSNYLVSSGNSTNDETVNTTNKCCDRKDMTIRSLNEKLLLNSKHVEEESELDLHSYVIVCNSGEYGTLTRGNKNKIRGSSTVINTPIPFEVPPGSLKRCLSTPSLPSDLELLPSELVLKRPHDSRHEEDDLELLGGTLKATLLQQVFCSLLLERKVIFVSSSLSKLSSCIEALQIILYPFSWQHTIIPVLPRSLWEIVDAPTPLVCGILSAEAIVVDLDEGSVLHQVGDEDKILPWCLIHTLKNGLNLASKITSNRSGAHNVFLSDAFLRVFIQSCGHYKNHIVDGKFEKANFIQNGKQRGKRIRQFLSWFTETTMFYNFIDTMLNESNNLDLFEQRIKIYSSESATEILNKMKNWTSYKSLVNSRFQ